MATKATTKQTNKRIRSQNRSKADWAKDLQRPSLTDALAEAPQQRRRRRRASTTDVYKMSTTVKIRNIKGSRPLAEKSMQRHRYLTYIKPPPVSSKKDGVEANIRNTAVSNRDNVPEANPRTRIQRIALY